MQINVQLLITGRFGDGGAGAVKTAARLWHQRRDKSTVTPQRRQRMIEPAACGRVPLELPRDPLGDVVNYLGCDVTGFSVLGFGALAFPGDEYMVQGRVAVVPNIFS